VNDSRRHNEATVAHDLYPAIEPYETGFLEVSGGHRLAYEVCGNPRGRPAVVLHGGPGAGCSPTQRRFFDPAVYKIVLFDQRGAGRSTPYASIDLNTTADLVDDIEVLRRHLHIERWLVFGGSWGSTLALAYAAAHPQACRALVLRGIWLCRQSDLRWWFESIRSVFPEYARAFAAHIPVDERGNLLEAYWRRLIDPDPDVHLPAATAWDIYETRCSTLLQRSSSEPAPSAGRLSMARLEAHYMRHTAFLRDNELIHAVPRFSHLPGAIVHGRYDMLCPVDAAVELAAAWPRATLSIIPDAGHSAMEPGTRAQLLAATDRFRDIDD
jgi:proline iminopeptidase